VDSDGKLDLFAVCAKGDALWMQKKDGVLERSKLWTAQSLSAAWGDFNGDGRLDCATVSAAGTLKLYLQDKAGAFTESTIPVPGEKSVLKQIHVITLVVGANASLIVEREGKPLLLANKGKDASTFEAQELPAVLDQEWGASGPCVIADFDNDGSPDVLASWQKNAVLYRGKPDGTFEASSPIGVGCGNVKERHATVADLDGDGFLEVIFAGGSSLPVFLQNKKGLFSDVTKFTGEPSYILQPGVSCIAAGDYNNDTFVDLFAGYSDASSQTFFNRGFRSFAKSEPQKFQETDVPECDKGQTAAIWADLDSEGTADLAFALSNGDVFVSKTTLGTMSTPSTLKISITPKSKAAGTLNVTLWRGEQCLGTRQASAAGVPAHFGVAVPGAYEVRWTLPGQKVVSRKVEITAKPQAMVVE
jgi:hypothetical protein